MPRINPAARRALVEQRKTQILTAAATVFAAKGFERATIANIAREAGIAEGSIYNYFKNKGDLLVSIPRQIIEPQMTLISALTSHGRSAAPIAPDQMLTTIARTMLSTVRQNAYVFRILISALPSMNQATRRKYMQQVVLYTTGMLEKFFHEQIKHGAFRRDLDPTIAARAFIGMFFPFVILNEIFQVETASDADYDRLITAAVTLFLRGALANPRERKSR